MEKDSFENLLRSKVIQAEVTINHDSDKERVWNSIQKKRKSRRKLYYAAASVVIMFFSFALYFNHFNQEQELITIKKELKIKNPESVNSLKENGNEIKIAIVPSRKRLHPITQTQLKMDTNVVLTPEKIVVAPEQEIAIATKNPTNVPIEQNRTTVIEPPFTVQFKRGISTVNHTDEGLIYITLKKFKLKRDPTYFANAEERQPIKLKLNFKKEN